MTVTLKYLSDKSYNSVSSESVSGSTLGTAAAAAAAAKLLQSCPTLCNPIDGRTKINKKPSLTSRNF